MDVHYKFVETALDSMAKRLSLKRYEAHRLPTYDLTLPSNEVFPIINKKLCLLSSIQELVVSFSQQIYRISVNFADFKHEYNEFGYYFTHTVLPNLIQQATVEIAIIHQIIEKTEWELKECIENLKIHEQSSIISCSTDNASNSESYISSAHSLQTDNTLNSESYISPAHSLQTIESSSYKEEFPALNVVTKTKSSSTKWSDFKTAFENQSAEPKQSTTKKGESEENRWVTAEKIQPLSNWRDPNVKSEMIQPLSNWRDSNFNMITKRFEFNSNQWSDFNPTAKKKHLAESNWRKSIFPFKKSQQDDDKWLAENKTQLVEINGPKNEYDIERTEDEIERTEDEIERTEDEIESIEAAKIEDEIQQMVDRLVLDSIEDDSSGRSHPFTAINSVPSVLNRMINEAKHQCECYRQQIEVAKQKREDQKRLEFARQHLRLGRLAIVKNNPSNLRDFAMTVDSIVDASNVTCEDSLKLNTLILQRLPIKARTWIKGESDAISPTLSINQLCLSIHEYARDLERKTYQNRSPRLQENVPINEILFRTSYSTPPVFWPQTANDEGMLTMYVPMHLYEAVQDQCNKMTQEKLN